MLNTKQIKKLADKKDILITGEPGTGKRYMSYQVHLAGPRKGSYLLLDGLSTNLAEVEAVLFGKNKDLARSTTGHEPAKLASHATLCIANADTLGPREQELLGEFLKEGRKAYTGLRVILTAVRMSKIGVDVAQFDQVEVLPLRDRIDEMPDLVRSILKSQGKESMSVGVHALGVLVKSSWPGNVRELVNVVSKGVLISKGDTLQLSEDYLSEHQHLQNAIENISAMRPFYLDNTLWLIERLLIERLMNTTQNNQSKAAELMGLSEANFRYRLKKFGVKSVRKRK